MTSPLDTHHTCLAHAERAFEEAFRRHPDDPYRALAWLLGHESSMPTKRADFFLTKFASLKKDAPVAASDASKPPAVLRELLSVLMSGIACLSPRFHDAMKLADEHNVTARDLLTFRRELARNA